MAYYLTESLFNVFYRDILYNNTLSTTHRNSQFLYKCIRGK